jgi:predicted flap endonuclease-1-like 5' DNA nuclease
MDERAALAENTAIAAHLRRAAELLEQQDATPYRAQAFRGAAATLAGLDESVRDIVERAGAAGLLALPGIGRSIAAAVAEMVRTGHWDRLDHLTGAVDPEDRFRAVPGIGPVLAREIHERLGIESLSDLEAAAWDGRLAVLPGMGPRRLAALRASLASVLERARVRPPPAPPPAEEPPAALLLDVDHEYRTRAAAGSLPRIAPKRFNPTHEPWLPILHTARGKWRFTALWSNTRRAHELGKSRDWVVIYFHDGHHRERQRTVVTETSGELEGRRVVRGREAECREEPRAA